METTFKSTTLKNGIKVNVKLDYSPLNPREEYENLGTIYANSHRHNWDKHMITELIDEDGHINADGMVYAKVFCYEHGLVALSVAESNPYSCPFDSALFGIIACTEEEAKKWLMAESIGENEHTRILNNFKAEMEDLEHYINGEVYGYEIEDKDGKVIDSCYGFYSVDEAFEEGVGCVCEDEDNVTYEVCPHCEHEVALDNELKVQKCPHCGGYLVTCSMCIGAGTDEVSCKKCPLIYLANEMNKE